MMMNTRSELVHEICDMVRLGGPTVDAYLNYAKRYADLAFQHAQTTAQGAWPTATHSGTRLLAILKLQEETPERVEAKIQAIQAKAHVTQVIACQHTMSLYIFGPDN